MTNFDQHSQQVETQYNVGRDINVYQQPRSLTVALALHNRASMLERVRVFWISGVLEQSLHNTALIVLGLSEQSDLTENPWRLVLEEPDQPARPLPAGTSITEVYDDVGGELLILGKPGSGKTTLLLELARDLLNRAKSDDLHPMPVVFNLASWVVKRQPIVNWLIEELNGKYQVPRKLAQPWVDNDQVMLLLDGLDEVASEHRSACVDAINTYRQEHGLVPIVVCSRSTEYLHLKIRLHLHSAVIIQPLTGKQIDDYLLGAGEQLEAMRVALRGDQALRELATTPLMLSVLALAYHGRSLEEFPETSSLGARRQEAFATYVRRMLQRQRSPTHYTPQQTMRWLRWLAGQLVAHHQTEFYIEDMQSTWLSDIRAVHQYYRLLVGLLVGLLGGLTAMLVEIPLFEFLRTRLFTYFTHSVVMPLQCFEPLGSGLAAQALFYFSPLLLVGLIYGLGFGLVGWLVGGLIGHGGTQQAPVQASLWLGKHIRQRAIGSLFGVGCGLIFLAIDLLWVTCPVSPQIYNQVAKELLAGLFAVLVGGLLGRLFSGRITQIQPAEAFVWSRIPNRRRVIVSLFGGVLGTVVGGGTGLLYVALLGSSQSQQLTAGLIGGLVGAGMGWLLAGFSQYVLEKRTHIRPNEGIRRSLRNGLIIGLPVSLALTGFELGLSFWLNPHEILIAVTLWFPLGLMSAVILVLLNGGFAYLQHVVLRFVLQREGRIPWNYPRFLDEAAERLLLRKVGGGYIFIHRLLLDYFASLN
jgi:DNA polymerase III delta prime subunit